MPPAVVSRESVELVDHEDVHITQQVMRVNQPGDEDRLERLWCREQDVRRLCNQALPQWLSDVPVPQADRATDQAGQVREPRLEVVQQRAQRAQVKHGKTAPVLVEHAGKDREHRRLGLAPGCGRKQQRVLALEDRADRRLLHGSKRVPSECVDEVVLQRRVEAIRRGCHSSSSTSSGSDPERAARSTSVSSPSETVRA